MAPLSPVWGCGCAVADEMADGRKLLDKFFVDVPSLNHRYKRLPRSRGIP